MNARTPLRLTVVSAGLGVPSSTRLLADRLTDATRRALAGRGRDVEVTVVELRDLATDVANNLVAGFPSRRLADALASVSEADGLIAVTPVFSASYSGLFKSFFDVLDNDALTGTPVLAAATGGTARHSLALEHALRPLFAYLRAVVVPTAVYAAAEDWGGRGDSMTEGLPIRIERAAGELADLLAGRTQGDVRAADDGQVNGTPRATEETVVPFEQYLAALRPD
ncbi:FMN reductase [Actinopolymorpha singaporensis]|uniref:FMN reductase n=1 Tax=Actinopolymorpha singaporensis TaxID=117157 RepID=A0A1H1LUS8_9ACTN|nr:FMN reductase [Actinopolymorpha singaporensis]SDR78398.1 FMN reductase [Actinopolymorpha singaporensis]